MCGFLAFGDCVDHIDEQLMSEPKRLPGRPPRYLTSSVLGDERSISQWAADLGIPSKQIHNRLGDGWDNDEALELVPRNPKSHPLTDDRICRLERRREQWRRASAKRRSARKKACLQIAAEYADSQ